MAPKKKRTKKQIAATKKLVAFNKKRRRKNPAKKKKPIGRRSQITKRAPGMRLKRRRAKKTVKGYFPNPSQYRIGYKKGSKKHYYDGGGMTAITNNAILFANLKAAKRLATKLANMLGRQIEIYPKR